MQREQVSEGSRGREETGEVESRREREREREREGRVGSGGGDGEEGGVWEKLLPRKKKRRRARRVPRGPHWGTKNKKKTILPQTFVQTPPPSFPFFFLFAFLCFSRIRKSQVGSITPAPPPPAPAVFLFFILIFSTL